MLEETSTAVKQQVNLMGLKVEVCELRGHNHNCLQALKDVV